MNNTTYQIHETLEEGDELPLVIEKVFKSNANSINSTLQGLDADNCIKAIEMIEKAENIEIYGFGGSSSVAQDLAHKFLKVGIKCHAYFDNDLQAMSASLLGQNDVVVAISHSGRNKALLSNLKIAHEAGATIIAVTDYGKTPISKIADVVLYTTASQTAFKSDALSSRIAQLTILDTLFVGVAFVSYGESQENIIKTRNATVDKKIIQE
jgi:DNA-binding MurR/RpiR family transcriptional regulator